MFASVPGERPDPKGSTKYWNFEGIILSLGLDKFGSVGNLGAKRGIGQYWGRL
jgi:hypothetical protein